MVRKDGDRVASALPHCFICLTSRATTNTQVFIGQINEFWKAAYELFPVSCCCVSPHVLAGNESLLLHLEPQYSSRAHSFLLILVEMAQSWSFQGKPYVCPGDGSLLLGSATGYPESQRRSTASLRCPCFPCRMVPDFVGVTGQGKKDDGIVVFKTGRVVTHSVTQGQTHLHR